MTERKPYFAFPHNPAMFVIRTIDESSWLIGDKLKLSHTRSGPYSWGDGHGGGYTISDAPSPLPETFPLSDDSGIKLAYELEGRRAVFFIGDAVLKIAGIDMPKCTREHVTLAWLHGHEHHWSFSFPQVIYHAQHGDIDYLVMSKMRGQTIRALWPNLDDSLRQQYSERVADICKELAISSESTQITGVDGQHLGECYLAFGAAGDDSCNPSMLRQSCLKLGMDCSKLVFYHCDMGPTNVLVDPQDHTFSVIDWECAGYVPVEWIATKYAVSVGHILGEYTVSLGHLLAAEDGAGEVDDQDDFKKRVVQRLSDLGYFEGCIGVAEAFMKWCEEEN